jgi:short-subunit dehydrogenase involved in D-alanine esterification of teichoic acids
VLQKAVAANTGMEYVVFDQSNADGARQLADASRERFAKLNVVINNAGIQRVEEKPLGVGF